MLDGEGNEIEVTEDEKTEVEDTGEVVLSKEAYETLLAQIAESTSASKKILEKVEDEEAEISRNAKDAARRAATGRYDKVNTPSEFAALLKEEIMGIVMEQAIQPVANTVMSIVVAQELKDVESKYPEPKKGEEVKNIPFKAVKEDVYNIVKDNPKLSLEDGYLIATGKKEKPEVKKAKDPGPSGERPGGPSTTVVEPTGKMTSKEAAKAAYDQVFGGKK